MKTRIVVLLFCSFVSSSMASAATVSNIFRNGDPANRIDIVVVSEGYTATESTKFNSDVNTLIESFFSRDGIFIDYKSYFNVQSLFEASAESGASHRELTPPVVKNTAFGAFYGCQGVPRFICANNSQILLAVRAELPANQSDYIMLLVNDPTYGGSGGGVAIASTHPEMTEVMLHEFGHLHGLLGDEYTENPELCNLYEPYYANVTRETVRSRIKWNSWIDAATPLPTTDLYVMGLPGLYEGALYCEYGMYRPTVNSKMRSNNRPFEQVNDEAMVRRLYNFVSPIDSVTPAQATLSLPRGAQTSFSVIPLQPVQHSLSVSWQVNGVLVASGNSFILDSRTLSVAPHSVRAIVRDNTTWVRNDPANITSDSQEWTVTVTEPPLSLSSTEVAFGSVNVSDVKVNSPAITLTNSGTAALTISTIQLTGTDASQFDVTSTCGVLPVQIAVGGNCTITPTFKPTRTGAMTATVRVSHNAGHPESVSLSGLGADFAITGIAIPSPPGQTRFTINLTTTASPTINPTTFTATGNSPGSTVTFNPQTIPAGSVTASTVMAIGPTTSASVPSSSSDRDAPLWPFTLTLFGTMLLMSTNTRVTGKSVANSTSYTARGILALLLGIAALAVGCGDKGGDGAAPPPSPPGAQVITVTATSGFVSRTTQVLLATN